MRGALTHHFSQNLQKRWRECVTAALGGGTILGRVDFAEAQRRRPETSSRPLRAAGGTGVLTRVFPGDMR
jgi:hypothetical protein